MEARILSDEGAVFVRVPSAVRKGWVTIVISFSPLGEVKVKIAKVVLTRSR